MCVVRILHIGFDPVSFPPTGRCSISCATLTSQTFKDSSTRTTDRSAVGVALFCNTWSEYTPWSEYGSYVKCTAHFSLGTSVCPWCVNMAVVLIFRPHHLHGCIDARVITIHDKTGPDRFINFMLPGPTESLPGPVVTNGNEMCLFSAADGGI